MKSISIGTKADGSQVLLAGPSVDPSKQNANMQAYKKQALPDGIIRVDQYTVDRPFAIAIKIVKAAPVAEAKPETKPISKGSK